MSDREMYTDKDGIDVSVKITTVIEEHRTSRMFQEGGRTNVRSDISVRCIIGETDEDSIAEWMTQEVFLQSDQYEERKYLFAKMVRQKAIQSYKEREQYRQSQIRLKASTQTT